MKHAISAVLVGLCLIVGLIRLQADDKSKTDEPNKKQAASARIGKLIGQLGDDKYENRQGAAQKLIQMGQPAIEALQKAVAQSKDPEVRWRAKSIIEKIQAAEGLKTPRGERPGTREVPFPTPRGQTPDEMQKLLRRFRMELIRPNGSGFQRFSFSSGNGGKQLSVTEKGVRYEFKQAKDGTFRVTVKKGQEKPQAHTFKSEANLREKNPALHAIWKKGAGIQIFKGRAMPFNGPRSDAMRRALEKQLQEMLKGRFRGFEELRKVREELRKAQGFRQPGQPRGPEGMPHGLATVKASNALLAQFELKGGVVVTRVSGGLAAKLGLKEHDVITQVNGTAVSSPAMLNLALDGASKTVKLTVLRKGATQLLQALKSPAPKKK